MSTPEQRQQWRLDATCVLGAASHWPESALDDSTRIIELLRELTIAEAENARLRALLAEDVALLEELDAAWGGAGGAGS